MGNNDLISDGMIRVAFVPTILDITAPKVTELTAGLVLSSQMTPDGLKTDISDTMVDSSDFDSTFDSERVGRSKPSLSVKLKRQIGVDTALTTMKKNVNGFLVVRRGPMTAKTAWTAADKCEVYPVVCGSRAPSQGPNSMQAYEIPLGSTSEPALDAVAVA